jgi:hypothetical protein
VSGKQFSCKPTARHAPFNLRYGYAARTGVTPFIVVEKFDEVDVAA